MSTGKSQYLKPDPSISSSAAADAFGGGEGNAELLIAANQANWSEHLEAANLSTLDVEATKELDVDEVERVAGVKPAQDSVGRPSVSVRGNYVVVVYEGAEGRKAKLVLHYDRSDGSMEVAEVEETADLARLRAEIEGQTGIEKAKREADKIIRDAREKASRISAEAERAALELAQARSDAATEDPGDEAADAVQPAEPQPVAPDLAETMNAEPTKDASSKVDWNSTDIHKPALDAEVKKRKLEVVGSGTQGRPTAADLRNALTEDDAKSE